MENRRSLTLLALLLAATGCLAASIEERRNRLEVYPSSGLQTKPIGSSILLTCKPEVENIKLVADIHWIDPHNNKIESRNNYQGTTKPSIYTEFKAETGSLQLFVNSLTEEQAGNYICKANYANQLLTNTVFIEAIVAITWEDAPENQYPIQGEDYNVRCQVRAKPAPQIDWIFNNEVIKTNDHYVIEPYSLKIKNVQASDDGVYTCRASVPVTGELKERAIRVEVHVRPKIEEFPDPIEVTEGEPASILCRGTGKPPPKFTWTKSLTQQDLSSTDRFQVDPYKGSLIVTRADREDEGEYQCAAENAAGRDATTVLVHVIVRPKISGFVNQTSAQGSKASLTCTAYGKPPPEIVFRKHTSERPFAIGRQSEDDRVVLTNTDDLDTTTGTLSIDETFRTDDGLYECIATNKGGRAFKNGHLTVEFPPSFQSMPNRTLWSWDRRAVNLTCIAESIPNATIAWTLHGDYKAEKDPAIKIYGNGPISVLNVIPHDRRYYTTYKCTATNKYGTATKDIELREAQVPGMMLQSKIKDITATSFSFELVPPEQEQDLPLDTIIVEYKEQSQPWNMARNRTWSVNSYYIVEDLRPQTTYEFRFAATNKVGRGPWAKNIVESTQIRSVPTAPRWAVDSQSDWVLSEYSDKYEVKWLSAVDNGEPIEYYTVRYCQARMHHGGFEVIESTCGTSDEVRTRSHWLKDLAPDTFYQVEVNARNRLGYGEKARLVFRTTRGNGTVLHQKTPLISSAVLIGIIVALLLIVLVIVDSVLCCTTKTGIIYFVCERSRKKPVDEDDAKLGRDEKEPLKEEKIITPIIDSGLPRESSVTFDGKRSISKTGFVGKDSAV